MNTPVQTIAITGANGFIGTILMRDLAGKGHKCLGFDRFNGVLFKLLTTRFFQPLPLAEFQSPKGKLSRRLWSWQTKIKRRLIAWGLIAAHEINILDGQEKWIERFQGCDTVVHLAAIPHPNVPGMRPLDFHLINYWGAVNIFEAAVAAGVKRFVFASSCQIYDINHNKSWDKFPIAEEDADRIQKSSTLHPYGSLKWKFEKYLQERSAEEGITSVALRLEFPGVYGGGLWNLWIQTSVENLTQAFEKALQVDLPPGAHVFNICNAIVPSEMGNLSELIREHWSEVPDSRRDNECLLDLGKARNILGYDPVADGKYYLPETVF